MLKTKKITKLLIIALFLLTLPFFAKAQKLDQKLAGQILLQVQNNGEAWYVNPSDLKRYFLGRPTDAFNLMKSQGVGIKHSELAKYLNSSFPKNLSGKILLDVEKNGEAYYVNPKNLKGYYLGRPQDALKVMKEVGLGINNKDLEKIESQKNINDLKNIAQNLASTLNASTSEIAPELNKLINSLKQSDLSEIINNLNIQNNNLNENEIKSLVENFINENLMQPGSKVTIGKISEENGLYKVEVNIPGGQVPKINSYITKDGKIFFTQGINIEEFRANTKAAQNSAGNSSVPAAQPPKSDKPQVDVFVMSHCPFGTQMEKGILPVMDLLDNDEAEIDIKFVHYAMHGEKELIEEEKQYCIQKNEEDKYDDYLKCFLASSAGTADESAECVDKVGINKTKLQDCIDKTDEGDSQDVKLNAEESKKFGVQGSPTLVINGEQISTSRDPQSLLDAICNAFNVKPSDCNIKLDTANPSAGFGAGTATHSGGGCGE